MATQAEVLDWSRDFALINPMNGHSQLALEARLNRRHQVGAARYGLAKPSNIKKRHIAVKLDFAMLLGRRCITFGTSRANNIKLPKGQGIGTVHFYIHFHPSTKQLLLTVLSKSGVKISQSATGEKKLINSKTISIHQSTYISFGMNERFCFNILPTFQAAAQCEHFEQLFRHWLKSVPEQAIQGSRDIEVLRDTST